MDMKMNWKYDMVLDDEPPRSEGTPQATGDERRSFTSRSGSYDVVRSKPQGSLATDVASIERGTPRFTKVHTIGSWNVRSMNNGKLEIVKLEMKRINLDILGISELRWIGMGHFNSEDYTVYYSGHETCRRNGVAFIAKKSISKYVLGYNPVNDRIISIRISGRPVNLTIIQVYAPTTEASEEDIDEFYGKLQEVIDATPKRDILLLTGDWNAKVGEQEEPGITGRYGLGLRNNAGERLIEFCEENSLFIANTCFKQHKRRLYTWTAPDGQHRNQIDYVLGQRRWRSAIQAVKTLPGADCGTDHELLVTKIRAKLRKLKRTQVPIRYDIEKIASAYNICVKNRFNVLNLCEREPNELWEEVKDIVKTEASNNIPTVKKKKRAKWLSEEAIKITQERKQMKAIGNLQEVRRLNAEFQRQARRDKEMYFNQQCQQLEEFNKKGKTRDLFQKIKELTGKFRAKVAILKDNNQRHLTEATEIKERWMNYTEDLYKRDFSMSDTFQEQEFVQEPAPLESEVRWAIQQLANKKAPGIDGIPIELFKAVGEDAVKVLTVLCQQIWSTTTWPKDWKKSVYVPILKRGDARECENYRTIALIPHASKVLLKILQRRLEPFMEREMPNEQAGFRKGRGTRDQIANIRWIMERAREYQKDVYLCFLDYNKAFDSVDHNKLWNVLREMGVPEHLIVLLKNLYTDQEAIVRTEVGETDAFTIGKGVRQGCVLSPYLFNLYTEHIMRMADLEKTSIGIKIGGQNINNLRYADDTTLLAECKEDLEELLQKVKEESGKCGLTLNFRKTKVMSTRELQDFTVDGEKLEIVDSFVLLGSRIDKDGQCAGEIKRRLIFGRKAASGLEKIFRDKDISIPTKIRIVKAMVFPVVLYGSESWTLRKSERKKIDAFELWVWRRLLRIPWTARRSNRSVLDQIKPECSLEAKIIKQKLAYFGHVMRADDGLEKMIMLSKVDGSRRRGRQRTRWMDGIKEVTGMCLEQLRELVRDRSGWRTFVHAVTRSRTRLNGT